MRGLPGKWTAATSASRNQIRRVVEHAGTQHHVGPDLVGDLVRLMSPTRTARRSCDASSLEERRALRIDVTAIVRVAPLSSARKASRPSMPHAADVGEGLPGGVPADQRRAVTARSSRRTSRRRVPSRRGEGHPVQGAHPQPVSNPTPSPSARSRPGPVIAVRAPRPRRTGRDPAAGSLPGRIIGPDGPTAVLLRHHLDPCPRSSSRSPPLSYQLTILQVVGCWKRCRRRVEDARVAVADEVARTTSSSV